MNISFVLLFILPVVAGTLILLTGAILLFIDNRKKRKENDIDTADWQTTGGKIVSSRLEQHDPAGDNKGSAQALFEPIVEYVYTVKDIEYRGNKVFPCENILFTKEKAQEVLEKHPVNMYVPVKYNPEDATQSSLENRPEGTNYIYLGGLVLTSFGILVCCFASFMTLLALGKYK